ncbi:MAG: glycosyltransferase family 2 protein [Candidatus Hodarchaeota archaeon]
MLNGKKVIVVLPAYNAEQTLKRTYDEIPHEIVDEIILVDDASQDMTVKLAKELNIFTYVHERNLGYGANQKNCYSIALQKGADIVIMLHPDYQYTPKLITAMASIIANELYEVVLGSRILGVGALKGGMPKYKYIANRILTFIQNVLLNYKLSEYHTGYRAFSKRVLTEIPLLENSDDFVFDNEMLAQIIYFGFDIAEVTCPTKYFKEASSISFYRSIKYGLGVLWTSIRFRLSKQNINVFGIFSQSGKKLKFIKMLHKIPDIQ